MAAEQAEVTGARSIWVSVSTQGGELNPWSFAQGCSAHGGGGIVTDVVGL